MNLLKEQPTMMITPTVVPRADDITSDEPSTSVLAKLLQRLAATTTSQAADTEALLDRAGSYADSQPSFAADLHAAATSGEPLACA